MHLSTKKPSSCLQLFLQICTKQYKNAREMEEHLSSYDHHHRKVSCAAPSLGGGLAWLAASAHLMHGWRRLRT